MKKQCFECGEFFEEDEMEVCPECGELLCVDCADEHIENCTEV